MKQRKKIWVPLGETFKSFGKDRFMEETINFDGMSLEQAISWLKGMQEKYASADFEEICIEETTMYAQYRGDSDRTYMRLQGYREMNDEEIAKEKSEENARKQNIAEMELRQYERLKAKFEGTK